jgi:hypothetical protein
MAELFRILLPLLLMHSFSFAQDRSIAALYSSKPIKIDGVLDDSIWNVAPRSSDFFQFYPFDSSAAFTRTEVMVAFDKEHLHIAAICHEENHKDHVIQSLKRDYDLTASDGFYVVLDPFSDQTNGFMFGVNPEGAQYEGLLQYGGNMGVSTVWDNKWFSEVKHYPDQKIWIVEMAIPFKTLRYPIGIAKWKINFARYNLAKNEISVWQRIPRNFSTSSLAFSGDLQFQEAPKKQGGNVAVIPYLIGTGSDNYTTTENDFSFKPNAGVDAKIAVSSSLNLDLTINPDFAQVEVDRQVTNLSRFSLFFPERRNFFLENSDLFERFGFRQIRPFFSRRIGLNSGQAIPILFGARLSGKINRDWRIGAMTMQTEGGKLPGLQGQNYSVAAVTYQMKGRSNISAILVNRQGFEKNEVNWSDYNRIAGIDWNIATRDNKLLGKLFFHHSFSPDKTQNAFAHASWLHYETPQITLEWNHEYVGHNYDAQTGFVPRIDYFNPNTGNIEKRSYLRLEPYASYSFYPKSGKVNNHGPAVYMSQYFDGQYKENERLLMLSYTVNFQNAAQLSFEAVNNFVWLYFDQDITFSDNTPLAAGGYTFYNYTAFFQSSPRNKLNYNLSLDYGGYYSGQKITSAAGINWRRQPWGIFSLTAQLDQIDMPDGFEDVSIFLISPRVDLSFTKSLFFTTFIQYNTQIENVNINSRLQWRFRPMSDIYLVYTENYDPFNISIKNRALAVKMVWWISV